MILVPGFEFYSICLFFCFCFCFFCFQFYYLFIICFALILVNINSCHSLVWPGKCDVFNTFLSDLYSLHKSSWPKKNFTKARGLWFVLWCRKKFQIDHSTVHNAHWPSIPLNRIISISRFLIVPKRGTRINVPSTQNGTRDFNEKQHVFSMAMGIQWCSTL